MMDRYSRLLDALRSVNGKIDSVFQAVVKSVEGNTCTISVGDLNVTGVRLKATVTDAGTKVLITPKKDTMVLVISLSGDMKDLAVISVDEADTVQVSGNFIFNEGKRGGLPMIAELKDNLQSIKEYCEAINAALPTAFTAIGIGSAANGTTAATNYQTAMSGKSIVINDMENENIKQ
jgi:hypothetical protein